MAIVNQVSSSNITSPFAHHRFINNPAPGIAQSDFLTWLALDCKVLAFFSARLWIKHLLNITELSERQIY